MTDQPEERAVRGLQQAFTRKRNHIRNPERDQLTKPCSAVNDSSASG
jgi:hypothetical protein